jgi:hypothetical protein
MGRAGSRGAFLVLLAAAMAVSPGSARIADPPVAAAREGPRGNAGLICLWGIYAAMVEVGKRCDVARNAAFEAALEGSISSLEDYARLRSPEGAAFMAAYRTHQIEGRARICDPDALRMYEGMSRAPPRAVRREADRLLESSPPVEWGACL